MIACALIAWMLVAVCISMRSDARITRHAAVDQSSADMMTIHRDTGYDSAASMTSRTCSRMARGPGQIATLHSATGAIHLGNASVLVVILSDPNKTSACSIAHEHIEMLRNRQTLPTFDVEILFNAIELRPGNKVVCPGIAEFGDDSLQQKDARVASAKTIHEYVIFVDGNSASAMHPTTLEKLCLVANGRSLDLASIQPANPASAAGAGDNVPHVCLPHRSGARFPACHLDMAPVLMRVPVWMHQRALAKWSNALVKILQPMTSQRHDGISPLSSVFCSGGNSAIAHSISEPALVITDKNLVGHDIRARRLSTASLHTTSCDTYVKHDASDQRAAARADIVRAYRTAKRHTAAFHHAHHQRMTSLLSPDPIHIKDPTLSPGFLIVVPWLEHKTAADEVNLSIVRALSASGVRLVVVTTVPSLHPSASDFYAATQDIFHLTQLVKGPSESNSIIAVLRHLVISRDVETVMISQSALGYQFISRLRNAITAARYGSVKYVDFVQVAEMRSGDEGYAAMSLAYGRFLDHTFVASQHVLDWMMARSASMVAAHNKGLTATTGADDTSLRIRMSVAHIGIDDREFFPPSSSERMRARDELLGQRHDGRPVLAYIAPMLDNDNDDMLPDLYIEIMHQLRDDRKVSFVSLLVGGEGSKLEKLRDRIAANWLRETVHTFGSLDRNTTMRILQASDVLLYPSKTDGVSLVAYKAMAMAVPPVLSAVGGQCELVGKEAGVCVPLDLDALKESDTIADAAEPFVDELEQLLKSPDLLRKLSLAARARIESEYSLKHMRRALQHGLCGSINWGQEILTDTMIRVF